MLLCQALLLKSTSVRTNTVVGGPIATSISTSARFLDPRYCVYAASRRPGERQMSNGSTCCSTCLCASGSAYVPCSMFRLALACRLRMQQGCWLAGGAARAALAGLPAARPVHRLSSLGCAWPCSSAPAASCASHQASCSTWCCMTALSSALVMQAAAACRL